MRAEVIEKVGEKGGILLVLPESQQRDFVAVRQPVEAPGIVVRDVHYQVRDAYSGRIAVPFDMQTNSTRASSDANGMYFKLDTSNLVVERSYVIDLKIITGNNQQLYKSASPPFRVDGTV